MPARQTGIGCGFYPRAVTWSFPRVGCRSCRVFGYEYKSDYHYCFVVPADNSHAGIRFENYGFYKSAGLSRSTPDYFHRPGTRFVYSFAVTGYNRRAVLRDFNSFAPDLRFRVRRRKSACEEYTRDLNCTVRLFVILTAFPRTRQYRTRDI